MPEEEAFAVLVALMQEYRLRDMFKPSMAELGVCMYQLEHLVADTHPELHAHFTAQGFHTSMYASSWFLTLFTTALSLPLACRIFDVFLSEGMEIIFKVALAMLQLGKEDLLSLDMEGMLKVIYSVAFNPTYIIFQNTSECYTKDFKFPTGSKNKIDLHPFESF